MNQHYSNAFRYYCDLVNLTLHIFVIFYFIRELLILYWCEFYIFNFYRTFSVQIWIVKISLKRSYSAFSLDSNCHGTDAYSIRITHLNESFKYSFMFGKLYFVYKKYIQLCCAICIFYGSATSKQFFFPCNLRN